jgi:formate dehydrogenase subunit delta
MTSLEKLIMMANQIAANLQHEPDPAKATAEHIRQFWDPRMKAMIAGNGQQGLSATAAKALALIDPQGPCTAARSDRGKGR